MSTSNLAEVGMKLDELRIQYKSQYDAYPVKKLANGQEAKDIPAGDIEGLRKLNSEINDLAVKHEELRQLHVGYEQVNGSLQRTDGKARERVPASGEPDKPEGKDVISRLFEKAGTLKRGVDTGDIEWDPRLEMKTTMTTSAGYTPFSPRSNVMVPTVQIKPTFLDYLPVVPIGSNSYKFMKETTFTNNADAKLENVAYGEAALALTETTVAMNRVGVYIPVTEDQLEDEPAARAYIEDRLRAMVRIKAEYQALSGNGTDPQWDGITALSGVQTVDASTFGSKLDAVFRAILNVNRFDATSYGGARANLVALNPGDWEDLVTMRTADGVYILGNPSDAPLNRVWGVPVAECYSLSAGTGLVLDTSFFPMGIRRGIRMAISDSHGENFISGVLAVRVDIKGNILAYRDAAAAKITNL